MLAQLEVPKRVLSFQCHPIQSCKLTNSRRCLLFDEQTLLTDISSRYKTVPSHKLAIIARCLHQPTARSLMVAAWGDRSFLWTWTYAWEHAFGSAAEAWRTSPLKVIGLLVIYSVGGDPTSCLHTQVVDLFSLCGNIADQIMQTLSATQLCDHNYQE